MRAPDHSLATSPSLGPAPAPAAGAIRLRRAGQGAGPYRSAWARRIALAAAASLLAACAVRPAVPLASADDPIQLSAQTTSTPDGPQRWVVARLDLTRVALTLTPGTGSSPDEFEARTTTAALAQAPAARLAVNASFYAVPPAAPAPGTGRRLDSVGLVVAGGRAFSPPQSASRIVDGVLCISQDTVRILAGADCGDLSVREAVAAGPVLALEGQVAAGAQAPTDFATRRHPRTAIALSADGATGWIVVVDGRQSDSIGATLPELTAFLTGLGASAALNLDGGGSTTLAVRNTDGTIRLLNRPIDGGIPGRERAVATHLLVTEVGS
jgi:hypothetical protein